MWSCVDSVVTVRSMSGHWVHILKFLVV